MSNVKDYEQDQYQPYEEVWLLFKKYLFIKYRTHDTNGSMTVLKLVSLPENVERDSDTAKKVMNRVFIENAYEAYFVTRRDMNSANELLFDVDDMIQSSEG